ncbi:MAG: tetratricopeptide repeat protein [Saprospiraceae bacterium]|jgi:tetratricopeptide (TPR) repeat protein
MRLNKGQWISIALFAGLFLILYLGFDTRSKEQKALVKSRAQNLEIININRLISDAKSRLPGAVFSKIQSLEEHLESANNDSLKLYCLEQLASLYYKESQALISGHYAKLIAEQNQGDAGSWAISGTTFAIAAKQLDDENELKYAVQESRKAFESALSIDPEDISSRINLALSYVDFPVQDNPMKGVLMLLELNRQYPENASVLLQLGRLALGTNQYDKAVERLTKVLQLQPDNKEAHCLLADVYARMGNQQKANTEIEICNS